MAQKVPKNACAGRTSMRLLPHRFPALLADRGPARTRASMRSNNRALLPRSAAVLGVLYGALLHLARTSLCYSSASPFHPTASLRQLSPTGWAPAKSHDMRL